MKVSLGAGRATSCGALEPDYIALDHVLALEDEEWKQRLAVLTADTLYLLECATGAEVFGQMRGRVALKDLSVQLNTHDAQPQLVLSTSNIFQRSVILRAAPGAADMHRWEGVLLRVIRLLASETDTEGNASDDGDVAASAAGALSSLCDAENSERIGWVAAPDWAPDPAEVLSPTIAARVIWVPPHVNASLA